jgi:hypothetical protein
MNPITNQTKQQFHEFLARDATRSERLAISFSGHQRSFQESIQRILDEYGLAHKLEKAKQQGYKLRLLQISCAEGLFLHELANLLEKCGLLEGADLYGITEDPTQISTADI